MNFTWFASAYDTDDVAYRLMVFAQMTGALVIAAGIAAAFDGHYAIVTIGYALMRLALVVQWLRAARADPLHRTTALRYAIGVTIVQFAWIARLWLPDSWQLGAFLVLALAEIAVPLWAERTNMTTWHPGHIAERYSLFTLIVLGESILSASLAIQSVIQIGDFSGELVTIIVGGLLIIFGMWWSYFAHPADELLTSVQVAFVWGYGHLLIFASAAAVGAGLAVSIDHATHHADISTTLAGAAVALPVAVYVFCLWLLQNRPRAHSAFDLWVPPIMAVLIALTSFSGEAVLLTGLLLTTLVVIKLASRRPIIVSAAPEQA